MLYVPPGFAHGFLVMSDDAIVSYKATAEYSNASEGGMRWNDPQVGIEWPLQEADLCERDSILPLLQDIDLT